MSKDMLGNRMKFYEQNFCNKTLIPQLPICVRLDGRNFSSYTKSFNRPYDLRLTNLMKNTTKFLLVESKADIAYTQSDEISLVWKNDSIVSEMYFGGKRDKINSILAAYAASYFNENEYIYFDYIKNIRKLQVFDCRTWQVPSLREGINYLIWREQDATRNSIQSAARSVYSHNECYKKNTKDLNEMLFQKGINWNDYPDFFKRGTYIKKIVASRRFSAEEMQKLPEKHQARIKPDLEYERTSFIELKIPPLTKLENPELVLFGESYHAFV